MLTLTALTILVTLTIAAGSTSSSGGWAEFRAFAIERSHLIGKSVRVRDRRCLPPRPVWHRNLWFRGRPGLYAAATRNWRRKLQHDQARDSRCSPREIGERMAANRYGWTDANGQWDALDELWGDRESGWNPTAVNPESGACGIPQFHPCSLPLGRSRAVVRVQIRRGLDYIEGRYRSPVGAIAFHNARGWY